MKIEAVDGVPTDFLEADIADLMHTPTEKPAPEVDVNEMFEDYDRELLAFKPYKTRQTWPAPIRKRT